MKQEPELIDIFAWFALVGILSKTTKSAKPEEIAFAAYEQAKAMIDERTIRDKSTSV
jgi:hypothetical protein